MSELVSLLSDIGMAVGPVLGYLYQYRLIKRTQQVGSFSIDICGILIFANVLRLNFYLFKHFQTALIFQSIFMITMQIFLLHLCAKFNPKKIQINMASDINETEDTSHNLTNQKQGSKILEMELFWRWQKFTPFALWIMILIGGSFTISVFCRYVLEFWFYGELIGLVSLISESLLILPQIIKNIRMGTTRGLSYMLLFSNLSGDILKLVYFLLKSQPFQFILCGIIQSFLDSFVIGQILYYRAKQKQALKAGAKNLSPIKRNRYVHEQFQEQSIESQIEDDSVTGIKLHPSSQSKEVLQVRMHSKQNYVEDIEEDGTYADTCTVQQFGELPEQPGTQCFSEKMSKSDNNSSPSSQSKTSSPSKQANKEEQLQSQENQQLEESSENLQESNQEEEEQKKEPHQQSYQQIKDEADGQEEHVQQIVNENIESIVENVSVEHS